MTSLSTFALWREGARLRTLPAAAAPVAVGSAAAFALGGWSPLRTALALIVALALQVGVNYSNDYSDGIRGTDNHRDATAQGGPTRLTGSGLVPAKKVLAAALGCFAVAGVAGMCLVALSGQWFLIGVGAIAVAVAWFYTGGRSPYGYMGIGLSELFVFIFFGLVATVGTTWTQALAAPSWLWLLASGLGLQSVAMLMVNNLRDYDTDRLSGKTTLVVRLGMRWSMVIYWVCMAAPMVFLVQFPLSLDLGGTYDLALSAALALLLSFAAAIPLRIAHRAQTAPQWVAALKAGGLVMLAWAALASVLLIARGFGWL